MKAESVNGNKLEGRYPTLSYLVVFITSLNQTTCSGDCDVFGADGCDGGCSGDDDASHISFFHVACGAFLSICLGYTWLFLALCWITTL